MTTMMTTRPLSHLGELFDEMMRPAARTQEAAAFKPATDIVEHENDYTLSIDLPGMERKDIELTVEKGVMTIKGQRRERKAKQENYAYQECWSGKWARAFRLPDSVDAEAVQARYQNGVLTVQLPKAARAMPRKIQINQG